jgi:putative membrane protein
MMPPIWLWARWAVTPEVAAALAVLLLGYLAALGPLRPSEHNTSIRPGQVVAFGIVLAMLVLVLTGPLADLADTFLFSAHMVQHQVLTLGVAPLLLYSATPWMLRPFVRPRPVLRAARFLTRPGIALATFTVVLAVWHVPVVYNLSLESRAVHATMHFTMLGAAILNWWLLMSPLPELPPLVPPLQILYVMVAGFPMVFVSAMVTLSPDALYPHYAAAPRVWGISPRGPANRRRSDVGAGTPRPRRAVHDRVLPVGTARARR